MWFFFKYYFTQFFNLGKKILLVLTTFVVIISLFIYFINKDKPKQTVNLIEKNRQEIYQTINNPELKKTKEGQFSIALYRIIYCSFIGEACTDNPQDGDKNFNHSIFGFVTKLITLPYANPPASGVYWAYSGLKNAGFVPKTYAAEGIGMAAIRPFSGIWKVFRDISYMLLVIVLISIGFMIMFRAKLNPQTVISVENSLPKIIISLILITFSFPIAGFLIDLMYVIIIIIIGILAPKLSETPTELTSQYLNPSLGKIFPRHFAENIFGIGKGGIGIGGIGMALFNILPIGLRTILGFILQYISGFFLVSSIKTVLSSKEGPTQTLVGILDDVELVAHSFGKLLRFFGLILEVPLFFFLATFGVPFLLAFLILSTIILIVFRIFFALFINYLQTVLLIIFSPFILILEAVPGKGTFSFWIKNLVANLLGFVVVIILILVSDITIRTLSISEQLPWAPPFIYGLDGKTIAALIGMGIYLLIPDFLKLIKQVLGAKGLPFELNLGMFFAGSGSFIGGGFSLAQKIPSVSSMLPISIQRGLHKGLGPFSFLIPPDAETVRKENAQAIADAISARGITFEQKMKDKES